MAMLSLPLRQGFLARRTWVVWQGGREVVGRVGGGHKSFVRLGEAVVPPTADLIFTGTKGSPDALVRFEVRDGRPECVEVAVRVKPDGRGIRTSDLAMFNLDDLTIDVFVELGVVGVSDPEERRQTYKGVQEARLERRGGVTRAELEEVARVYREHIDESPTRAVELLLGYSRRTAARRVEQARTADPPLLPRTSQGKRKA